MIVLWIICSATRRAATAVFRQALRTRRDFDHPVTGFGRDGTLASKGRMGCVLSIQIIVLSTLTTVMFIRGRHLQNRSGPAR